MNKMIAKLTEMT